MKKFKGRLRNTLEGQGSSPRSDRRRFFRMVELFCIAAILVGGVLPLASHAGSTPALLKRDWIEVKTPNFTINSVLGEKKTLELARELETFRAFIIVVTSIEDDASPIPTEIFVLKRQSDLRKWVGVSRDVGGFFYPGVRQNVVGLFGSKSAGTHIIQHEYVHFLMGSDAFSRQHPSWVVEGFAEYFGGTFQKKDRMIVGDVPPIRRSWLEGGSWISGRELILGKEGMKHDDVAMFYGQAWLLAHYLSLGRPERNFQADMTAYLSALNEGTPDPEAFELAFELEVARLNRTLRKYGGSMTGRIVPSEMFETDYTPRVRTLTKSQAAERLAGAALEMNELAKSKPLIEYALAHDPGSSLAWANSGRLHVREKEYEAAFANIEKAIQLDPKNPYPLIDMADLIVAQSQSVSEPAKERRAKLAEAAQFSLRAWKLDPSIPEVYATYGQVLLEDGQRPEKAVEMLEEASFLLPARPGVRFLLAQALYAADQDSRAMEEAKSILKTTHLSQGLTTAVEETLAEWQEAEDQGAPAQVVDAGPN